MKNHQVSATLHWTLTYCFSLGTQPDSMVYVEAPQKSHLDVYIRAKVFEGRLDQCEGANHWERNGNSDLRTHYLGQAHCLVYRYTYLWRNNSCVCER